MRSCPKIPHAWLYYLAELGFVSHRPFSLVALADALFVAVQWIASIRCPKPRLGFILATSAVPRRYSASLDLPLDHGHANAHPKMEPTGVPGPLPAVGARRHPQTGASRTPLCFLTLTSLEAGPRTELAVGTYKCPSDSTSTWWVPQVPSALRWRNQRSRWVPCRGLRCPTVLTRDLSWDAFLSHPLSAVTQTHEHLRVDVRLRW